MTLLAMITCNSKAKGGGEEVTASHTAASPVSPEFCDSLATTPDTDCVLAGPFVFPSSEIRATMTEPPPVSPVDDEGEWASDDISCSDDDGELPAELTPRVLKRLGHLYSFRPAGDDQQRARKRARVSTASSSSSSSHTTPAQQQGVVSPTRVDVEGAPKYYGDRTNKTVRGEETDTCSFSLSLFGGDDAGASECDSDAEQCQDGTIEGSGARSPNSLLLAYAQGRTSRETLRHGVRRGLRRKLSMDMLSPPPRC